LSDGTVGTIRVCTFCTILCSKFIRVV